MCSAALYELLVLKPVFESPDRLQLIDIVTKTEVASPRSIDPGIRDCGLMAAIPDQRVKGNCSHLMADMELWSSVPVAIFATSAGGSVHAPRRFVSDTHTISRIPINHRLIPQFPNFHTFADARNPCHQLRTFFPNRTASDPTRPIGQNWPNR
jgi:hypothetical protein